MQGFFKNRTVRIVAGILAALLLGMSAAAVSSSASSPFTKAVSLVFSPLQSFSSYISDSLSSFSGSFVSSSVYRQRIEELELQLDQYREQLVDYEKTKQLLSSYENFLEVKENNPDFELAFATITGRDPAEMFSSFVINKGSSSGVKVNDPVIFESYLVGIIKEVNLTTSVVCTLIDPRVNISAYEVRSREDAYISNTAELSVTGLCRLSGLSRATAVLPGGIVCTSGVGGVYPRDLIIGTVKEVKDQETDLSSYAVIEPGVDFSKIIDIAVITSFMGQGE